MSSNPYGSLVGSGLAFAGVDQGIDFTGRGLVYAPGAGVITRLLSSGSGWPGEGALLVEHLTEGAGKGRNVYIAEDFRIAQGLHVGSKIVSGEPLGIATGSGRAPGIEIGWADPGGHAFGHAHPREPQPMGYDFQRFVSGAVARTRGSGGSIISNLPGDVAAAPGAVVGAVGGAIGGALGGVESLVLRGLLILAGVLLALAGLVILGHALGAKIPAAAAAVVPQARLAKLATIAA